MPMRTFLSKSTPSTSARKPCTKCCRACSPSLTMSMPASSWRRMASAVASSLASSSGAPVSVHGAHRTLGVASHEGLGRLPASVVSNILFPSRLFLVVLFLFVAGELQLRPRLGRQHMAERARRTPLQGAEGAAALAHRTPGLVLGRAGCAAPGAVGRRIGGAGQPIVHLGLLCPRTLLDLGHQAADAHRRAGAAGDLEMPPRLAPQRRLERDLGQREMALDVVLVV